MSCQNLVNVRQESNRPYFHFAPEKGWMNDPNGLVFFDGEYHLFYQHIPDKIVHGSQLHWGHAKSLDLFTWQHLPIALYPDDEYGIWSGSIVIDYENTSGLKDGEGPVWIAVFTRGNDKTQEQAIACSNDRGTNWTMYAGNPVIPNPGLKDFRDPNVFWHKETKKWILILTAGEGIIIYTSSDLKLWEYSSEFSSRNNGTTGIWECPDLFEMAVNNDPDTKKWVMLVSRIESGPNGGSGTQYFIGDFDGKEFTNSYPDNQPFWLDYGKDNYAGTTFSNIPENDGRRLFLAWMNTWQYANDVPAQSWRGMMTIPCELKLRSINKNELCLVSQPADEINYLRKEGICFQETVFIKEGQHHSLYKNTCCPLELHLDIEFSVSSEFGIIFKNAFGESVTVGYSAQNGELYLDRRNSGQINFNSSFAIDKHRAPMRPKGNTVKFKVFLDTFSIEIFANNGQTVMTELLFPEESYNECGIFSTAGEIELKNAALWKL